MLVYAVEGVGTYMYVYVVCQKIKILKKLAPTDKQNKREIKRRFSPLRPEHCPVSHASITLSPVHVVLPRAGTPKKPFFERLKPTTTGHHLL